MKKLILIAAILILSSCDDEPLNFFSLGELRILALQADTPEIDGTSSTPVTVQITPVISDVDAGGRTLSFTVLACPDPGITVGMEPTCDTTLPTTQTITYADVNSSTLGARFTGALPAFSVNVPPGLLIGQTEQNRFNGLNYIVTFKITAGSDEIETYKRIVVSERTTKNLNPQIQNVLLNGSTSGSLASGDELSIDVSPGFTPETFDFMDNDGLEVEKTETYTISWFSYKGTTDLSRTYLDEVNLFTLNTGETDPFVVAILRDDRGGIDFQLKE